MTDTQTILITGATDGLGRALAEQLAAEGADVVLHGRDQAKLDRLADRIAAGGAARPPTVLANLADLGEVRTLAADVRARTGRLDVLVNNAGIGFGEPDGRTRRISADGYELRFAVNYLAGFLLTLELLPLLRASAPARVVNVASAGQYPIDFADLMMENHYDGVRAYRRSKLAQIMFGFDLAARLPASQVTVNGLHPASFMPTKMVMAEIGHTIDRIIDSLEEGVRSVHRLAVDPALLAVTGRYFNGTSEARALGQAYDPEARERLWQVSLELTGANGDA
jgi:NAD(P)-dependent dehydrogenase (short-subunit alcohol dehydrogenase family)